MLVTTEEIESERFPLLPALISREQRSNTQWEQIKKENSEMIGSRTVEGVELYTYSDKIYIPVKLRQRIVAWYHEYLQHPGHTNSCAPAKSVN